MYFYIIRWRYHVCAYFSWGLLPEGVAAEVASTLRGLGAGGLVDPLAGSGWHARLLADCGLAVCALDNYPVRPVAWCDVRVVADARSEADWGSGRSLEELSAWALLLSWPPHSPETVGQDLLCRWPGRFLVYLGERGAGELEGVTGGRALTDAIAAEWEPVRSWPIPRWPGYEDDLTLYRRRGAP